MRRIWGLVVVVLGGCSLYFGEPPPPAGPDPQPPPPATPPMDGGGASPAYATLAHGPGDVMDIAVSDGYVYWLVNHQSSNQSDVYRVPKDGGAMEQVTHVDGRVYQFALDDTYVYLPVWNQSDAGAPFLRVLKTGGTPEVIDDHFRYLYFVAVHGDAVYTAPLVDESTIDYQLWKYPLGGGSHTVLVDGLRGPESVAFDSTSLYVTTAGDSGLHEAPLAGGTSMEPLPSLDALHVLSDGDRIYFMSGAVDNCASGHISAWQRGGTTMTDLGPTTDCALDLALTSRSVLAADLDKIFEYPLDGSGLQTVVSGLTAAEAIAAEPDGSSIYWGDFETGEIDRLDR